MNKIESHDEEGGVSVRTIEAGVAATIMAFGALVMFDNLRTGIGWTGGTPDAGYFPFYVGLLMTLSSGIVLLRALVGRGPRQRFLDPRRFGLVLALLVPTAIFVAASAFIGIYVASALYLTYFMIAIGHYRAVVAVPLAIGIPFALFLLFEIWFLVPLPKGPLEYWLGY